MASFRRLDSVVSKPLLFDGGPVIVPYADFTNEKRAALVTLFKFQEEWPESFWVIEEGPGAKNEDPDDEFD